MIGLVGWQKLVKFFFFYIQTDISGLQVARKRQQIQKSAELLCITEAYMASEDLVLDRKVRDWVVVPLTLCILLMMLLRQYVAKVRTSSHIALLQLNVIAFATHVPVRLQMLASPGSSKQAVDLKELREKQALARSQLMRANAGYIPASAIQQRRNFFTAKVSYAICTHCRW